MSFDNNFQGSFIGLCFCFSLHIDLIFLSKLTLFSPNAIFVIHGYLIPSLDVNNKKVIELLSLLWSQYFSLLNTENVQQISHLRSPTNLYLPNANKATVSLILEVESMYTKIWGFSAHDVLHRVVLFSPKLNFFCIWLKRPKI